MCFFYNATLAVNVAYVCSHFWQSSTQLVAGGACEGRQRTGCGRALWQQRKLSPPFASLPHLQPQLPTMYRLSCREQWKGGRERGEKCKGRRASAGVCEITFKLWKDTKGRFALSPVHWSDNNHCCMWVFGKKKWMLEQVSWDLMFVFAGSHHRQSYIGWLEL